MSAAERLDISPLQLTLSVHQVAAMFGKSSKTIRRWVDAGKFPAPLGLPGYPQWRRSDVVEYLEGLPSRK